MKKSDRVTPPIVWAITITITLIIGLLFLRPFLAVIALGILLAYIFYPMYEWFLRKLNKKALAAAATCFAFVFVVGLPSIGILTLTAAQTIQLVEDVSEDAISVVQGQTLTETVESVSININTTIEKYTGIDGAIEQEDVSSFMSTTLPKVLNNVAQAVLNIVSGIPAFITLTILFFFVFPAALMGGKEMKSSFKRISPFDEETNDLYLDRLGAMAKAMFKGQLLIAFAQGLASAAVLSLFGFADYFLFFLVAFTFMSFIPLGAGIVTIPLGAAMILLGNVFGGVMVLLNHFIVVTNIDNYIRPKVVPESARMPATLTILGAFCGVAYFGFLGVIYGPMIMIFIVTTIESYIKYKERHA